MTEEPISGKVQIQEPPARKKKTEDRKAYYRAYKQANKIRLNAYQRRYYQLKRGKRIECRFCGQPIPIDSPYSCYCDSHCYVSHFRRSYA
jgi:hypothetical protein